MRNFAITAFILVTTLFSNSLAAQPIDVAKSQLLDEFGRLPHCDLTGRYDLFFAELAQREGTRGYVIIYKGTRDLPATYDVPIAARLLTNHIGFRRFDSSRITVVEGGFKDQGSTQLWIVPPGIEAPKPENTVAAPTIPYDRPVLFDTASIVDEGLGVYDVDFTLPAVKRQREEKARLQEEEYRKERIANGEKVEDESTASTDEQVPEDDAELGLTAEEKEELRFAWVSEAFGKMLAKRKGTNGVLIFYADDKEYDIAAIRRFMKEGVKRLESGAKLNAGRITVKFGGYRSYSQIDYWLVPVGGKQPMPTPEEQEDPQK